MSAVRTRDQHDEEVEVGSVYDRRLLARLLQFARPHRWALLGSVGLLVASLAARLAGPWLIQRLIDGPVTRAVRDGAAAPLDLAPLLDEVTRWGLLFLGVAAAGAVLVLVREWLMNRTGQRIVFELRNALFRHLLRLPVAWFDRHPVGWTVTRTTSDVDALSELFTTGVATLAYDLLTIAVIMVVLCFLAPQLALVALLLLPAMIFVSFRFRLNARVAYRATRASLSRMNAFLQERLSGLAVVRLFRREAASSRRFDQLNTQYYRDNLLTVRHFSLFFPTVDVLSRAVKMGCFAWGGWLLVEGSLSFGVFFQFWMYLDYVFEPIRELAERYNVLQAAMAAAERIFGILDTPIEAGPAPELALAAASATPAAAGSAHGASAIEFRDVSFAYGPGPPVLQEISFHVAPGERVAVVGHTGAGKTTLVSLLCRFYEVGQGRILVHGRDVRAVPQHELRRRITVVHQDVFLFSDTLAANIRMSAPEMPQERVAAMAAAVEADAFIRRLPSGYETRLLERGANLSSGQRQLVAFARALAAQPDILVLDEATSSVDSETEAAIERATERLMRGRTCLVIAHRLSTVVGCDRILVMHKGRLHEQGTHAQLMARRGLYWKLYRLH
ncbi:MAG TPA: ABC transporter ATP-binding protein, partial [Planctomycetota bacterium]|nr:ABC transporter ATP-binding protein [Planctomycetota bacterium]